MLAYVIRHRPSPAMVVACAALTVALGGTGYAALKLPRNSVGTKQLKNSAVTNKKLARGAVTAGKVVRNSLTGTQINEGTLGTVPNATHASSADSATNATSATTATTAQNVAAPEAFHNVGASGEPAFQNSWQNIATTTYGYPAGFYKDRVGVVHLVGRIVNGSGNSFIFQLPPGYRPATGKYTSLPAACECTTGQTTIVSIQGSGFSAAADGSVSMTNGTLSASGSLWLDGISFLAES
jgi:hypothetical protein